MEGEGGACISCRGMVLLLQRTPTPTWRWRAVPVSQLERTYTTQLATEAAHADACHHTHLQLPVVAHAGGVVCYKIEERRSLRRPQRVDLARQVCCERRVHVHVHAGSLSY
jgi:hypothetical protein